MPDELQRPNEFLQAFLTATRNPDPDTVMPKLFDSIRPQVEGIRAQRVDFEKTLEPLRKLTALQSENTAKQAALLAQLLDAPTDSKLLTAYRSTVATAQADQNVFTAAHAAVQDRLSGFTLELKEILIDLIRQADALVLARLEAEGFALRGVEVTMRGKEPYENAFGAGDLVEIGGEGIPFPNKEIAAHLLQIHRNLHGLLENRTINPVGLQSVLSIVETSPI
jgi:hypothetical protein